MVLKKRALTKGGGNDCVVLRTLWQKRVAGESAAKETLRVVVKPSVGTRIQLFRHHFVGLDLLFRK